jgi:hypothetical protein
MRRSPLAFLLPSLAALALSMSSGSALACGGTLCDNPGGPTPPMPVDQTGENILFVMDGQSVEAHVQIQYSGDPERFAWLVPMPVVPEVSAGSQVLFSNLLSATVPRFLNTATADSCSGVGRGSSSTSGGCGVSTATSDESAGFFGGSPSGAQNASDPRVVERQHAGAFDIEVLSGGTSESISAWLKANSYLVPPTLGGFLQPYLEKNFVFVAVKLSRGTGSDEIHPLVFKYPGNEPCVPIRLTAVAAKEDMGIRAFFLSSGRFVPKNYKHVILNDTRIDWLGTGTSAGSGQGSGVGANYNQVVSRAVDSPIANGHAFVTEYAGPSSAVSKAGIYSTNWKSAPFAEATPQQAVAILSKQNSLSCSASNQCSSDNPLVIPLLRKFVPVPPSVNEGQFYNGVSNGSSTYVKQIDMGAWNGPLFAQEYEERIAKPGKHGEQVLIEQAYLTRMFTTISPNEMTEDPEFFARPDQPTVNAPPFGVPASATDPTRKILDQNAQLRTTCDGQRVMNVPSGREVALARGSNSWPQLPDAVPWAERVEEFPAAGPPILLRNNSAAIDGALEPANKALDWPPTPQFKGDGTTGSCSYQGAPRVGLIEGFFAMAAAGALARRLRRRR